VVHPPNIHLAFRSFKFATYRCTHYPLILFVSSCTPQALEFVVCFTSSCHSVSVRAAQVIHVCCFLSLSLRYRFSAEWGSWNGASLLQRFDPFLMTSGRSLRSATDYCSLWAPAPHTFARQRPPISKRGYSSLEVLARTSASFWCFTILFVNASLPNELTPGLAARLPLRPLTSWRAHNSPISYVSCLFQACACV
jgi:hypothetical protein